MAIRIEFLTFWHIHFFSDFLFPKNFHAFNAPLISPPGLLGLRNFSFSFSEAYSIRRVFEQENKMWIFS